MEEKGEHVGGGTFRVDREAALKKLAKYQVADPWHFVRAWARAAVLSGPSRVEFLQVGPESVLRFDGAPLAGPFEDGPLSAMFSEDDAGPARHVAVGVLAAQRLGPERIRVRSGGRAWTWTSEAEGAGIDAAGPTELGVAWRPDAAGGRHVEFKNALVEACGMLDVPLYVDGVSSTPYAVRRATEGARSTGSGPRRAVLSRQPTKHDGEVFLYRDGILLGGTAFPGFELLSVHLNDDRFKLDLSACLLAVDHVASDALEATVAYADMAFPRPSRVPGRLPGEIPRPLAVLALAGLTLSAFFLALFCFQGEDAVGVGLAWLSMAAALAALTWQAARGRPALGASRPKKIE